MTIIGSGLVSGGAIALGLWLGWLTDPGRRRK
jgi:hypothetical protein